MDVLNVVGFSCLGITGFFWLIFSLGTRHCHDTSMADFMLAGGISMFPLFISFCAFML